MTDTKLRFQCPACSARLKVPNSCAGRMGRCHHCRAVIQIPLATSPNEPDGFADAPPHVQAAMARLRSVAETGTLDAYTEVRTAQPMDTEPSSSDELTLMPPVERFVPDEFSKRQPRRRQGRLSKSSSSRLERRSSSRRSRIRSRGSDGRDLRAESHVRAFAFWMVLMSGFTLVLFVAVGLAALVKGQTEAAAGSLLMFCPLMVFFGSIGIGLWRYMPSARVLGMLLVIALLNLAWVPMAAQPSTSSLIAGTIPTLYYGAMFLVLVSSKRLFEATYRSRVASSSATVPFWTSPFFWIPPLMFVVSVVLAVVLAA